MTLSCLSILKHIPKENHRSMVLCQCICGNTRKVSLNDFKRHHVKSCGCNGHKQRIDVAVKGLYSKYKYTAKKRNLSFELSLDEFKVLTKQPCTYCNIPPEQVYKKEGRLYMYNGIDRTDSKKGYFRKNCVACCGICNHMKTNMNIHVFTEHIIRISKQINRSKLK